MPRMTVVDVGDGACTILRCPCVSICSCEVAVVDCGVWRGARSRPTEALIQALGPQIDRLGVMVVTHFDADHWEGLRLLSARAEAGSVPKSLDIFYPRVPDLSCDTAAADLAARMTVAGPTGVRSLDLVAAWAGTGRIVRRRPLSQGDVFTVADREWTVLWPPRDLDRHIRPRIAAAVAALEQLADDMDRDGHPALRQNIDAARTGGFSSSEGAVESERRASADDPGDFDHDREDEFDPFSREETPHGEIVELGDVSPEYGERFKNAVKAIAEANNDLSLVFYDRHGTIFFGDVGGIALRRVLRLLPVGYFSVLLPPHHGTHRLPPGFPHSAACVAQAGAYHAAHWPAHVAMHRQPRSCICTALVGTVSFW